MATGGGFERSIDKGCDQFYDYSCTPCSADLKNVEAINYCVECDEYLCVACFKYHSRFVKMRSHQILDQTAMKSRRPLQTPPQPTERCELHHGNILDTFCAIHDAVCCSTCVSLFHKSCNGVEYLPTAAVGIQKSKEFQDIKLDIQNIELQLNNMKKTRQDELGSLEQDKKTIIAQIKDFRKTVMKRLEDLEKVATDELELKHQKFQDKINVDIKHLEEILASMATSRTKLEAALDNESKLFVQVKTGKKNSTDGRKLLHDMESHPHNRVLKFKINPNIEDYINSQESLGELQELSSASLYGEFNMKVSKDKETCHICGTCVLDNGSVLVADYKNSRLKRLDGSYCVRDYCDLPAEPFAVCATGPQEVAVTLVYASKILFVSVGDKMTLTRSFSIQRNCGGVAYTNNQLFVSRGIPSALLVCNMSGTLLKTIQQDTTGQSMFSSPYHITLSRDQTKMHIADGVNGLITLGIHGDKQSQFTDTDLENARGVCVGNNDEIFVCGYSSCNIIQIGRDGSKLGVVLGPSDGIKCPQSLFWDRTNSRLIVTMANTNYIKVFDMYK